MTKLMQRMVRELTLSLVVGLVSFSVQGQEKMESGKLNFFNFATEKYADQNELANFSNSQGHPEYGILPYNAPCDDCIEVIEERTQYSRKFITVGTNGTEVKTQKGYSPLHYKDNFGRWITYNPQLKPLGANQFGVSNDYYKINIDPVQGYIFFENYHNNLEPLVYHKNLQFQALDNNGQVLNTINANWSNYSVGDDGMKVTNIFPGIDLEIYVFRAQIKTNFIVNQNLGSFRIEETLENDVLNRISNTAGNIQFVELEENGGPAYLMSDIKIFGSGTPDRNSFVQGYYTIEGNKLYYNWEENDFQNLNYPITIDPTVTSSNTLPQGSIIGAGTWANNGSFDVGCTYNLTVATPANCTITDIDWTFSYVAQNGATMSEGACKFYYGACVSPATAGFFWYCNDPIFGGTCNGVNISIFSDFQACVPAPQCSPYNMDFTMEFFDAYGAFNASNCDPTYITAGTDWTMVITGETVAQPNPPTSSAGSTICEGQSTNLTATATFGVPPYSYSWDNGAGSGNPVSVSPTTTTTYTCTITDACSQTATNSFTVNVNPAPDAGTSSSVSFCATDPVTSLLGQLGGTPDATGSWSGPSALGGGSSGNFNPATMNAGVYTYTVNGTPPCTNASSTVTVTLSPAPDAGTNGSTSFCPSDPSADLFNSLGGTPDAGGTWSPALASGSGVFNPAVDPGGTYTYTVTNSCGTATADVNVTLNPNPDPGTNGSATFCPSDPSADLFNSLGGTPDAGGTWSPAMASGSGVFNPAVDPAGTYTYTVTNSCGSLSADVVVTINPAPDAGTNGSASFCPSDPSADLINSLGGTPDAGGSWSPALTSGSGVFDPAVDGAGTYTYTVTNSCGSATADVAVTINPAPDAGTNGSLTICATDPSTDLFNQLGGTPDAGGTWSPAMASGSGVFDPAVDPAGTYTYTVTNGCGTISADVTVSVVSAPDAGTNGSTSFCPSDPSADLFNSLGGTPDVGGTWSPALTSGSGVFDPAVDPAGTYTYTVSASCGTSSADVTVTIDPAPNAGSNGSTSFCPSDAPADLFNSLGGTPDAGGTWSPALTSGSGVFDPATDAAGTYTYSVTTVCGTATADVVVTINPNPDAGTNGAISYCPSDPSSDLFNELGGTPDAGGTWSPALTSGSGVFDPATDAGGTYTYTVTNTCGTATADVVVTINPAPDAGTNGAVTFCPTDAPADLFNSLGGTPDAGGTWSPALTSGTGVFDPATDPAGTYTYSVTNSCGTITADVVVTISANPSPGTNGAVSLCSSDAPIDLFNSLGGTPDAGGTWSPALTSGTGVFDPSVDPAGTYTYTVTACGGGPITADVVVTLNPSPNAGTNGTLTLCDNDPATDLFNALGGTPDAGGTWSPALTSGTGMFDPTVDAAGTYTYSVTNSCGTATADVNVTVTNCAPPVADFTMSDTALCIGECVNLMDMSTGGITAWEWDFGGAATPNTSTDPNPVLCPTVAGTFSISLTVTNANGTNTATATLLVGDTPSVTALGDTIIGLGESTDLYSLVSPLGGSYSWTDGDNDNTIDCITCPDIVVTPDNTTNYVLTYTSAFGCSASDSATVFITVVDMVDVPNGFSPNGDGLNDILFVKGKGIDYMKFTIYNRYGQKVFESDDQNIGWDGTFMGVPENPGVFAWYVEYTLIDGTQNFKKGNVTLIK
ncbi:MAG: gliding motility-associated C-terminal domain-containing protein [Crocinitomicaceae bacterium]|nr:gliding motility-associated C-terminal domain-containing protein [Crocinitomicaceae bacterium]